MKYIHREKGQIFLREELPRNISRYWHLSSTVHWTEWQVVKEQSMGKGEIGSNSGETWQTLAYPRNRGWLRQRCYGGNAALMLCDGKDTSPLWSSPPNLQLWSNHEEDFKQTQTERYCLKHLLRIPHTVKVMKNWEKQNLSQTEDTTDMTWQPNHFLRGKKTGEIRQSLGFS